MKQFGYVIGILPLVMAAMTANADQAEGLEAALRQVVDDNLAAYNNENLSGTLESIHTSSPDYDSMKEALPNQFGALDTETQLESFRYIGHGDEFAVARVKYRTVARTEEPFMNNIRDTITMFHQEDGAWKYWSDYTLGVFPVQ